MGGKQPPTVHVKTVYDTPTGKPGGHGHTGEKGYPAQHGGIFYKPTWVRTAEAGYPEAHIPLGAPFRRDRDRVLRAAGLMGEIGTSGGGEVHKSNTFHITVRDDDVDTLLQEIEWAARTRGL
jgi:SLT domain-containing protein